jgi:neutral ceramidase
MGFEIVKTEVVARLNKTFGPNLYTDKNVLMSGTHTHSTPGGTALVDITTLGFV